MRIHIGMYLVVGIQQPMPIPAWYMRHRTAKQERWGPVDGAFVSPLTWKIHVSTGQPQPFPRHTENDMGDGDCAKLGMTAM